MTTPTRSRTLGNDSRLPLFLGLDLSTQSLTSLVLDSAGNVVSSLSLNFDRQFPAYGTLGGVLPGRGDSTVVHGDPLLWAEALEGMMALLGREGVLSRIRAVAVSAQQHGTVYLKSLDMTFRGLEEKGRLLEFDPVLATHQTLARQAAELNRIQQISDYEFYLEFQPQVSTRTGLCTGCEALMRARDSQGTVHSPWEFLQWLAHARLMPDVDVWVASQAVRQYQKWQKVGFELPMTINISSTTLKDAAYGDRLVEILGQARGQVSVEITEDALVSDIPATRQTIQKLQAMGAKVYLDDFGTGFSALSYLHQFPVDFIKIDRSFVVAQHDPKGAQVLTGMLRFCEALDLGVVVEGVETAEQLAFLSNGPELFIQGWYFSRALPGDQLPRFVLERRALV